MEPVEVKKNIKEKIEAYNQLKEDVLKGIKSYTDYLNRVHEADSCYISATKQPFTLRISRLEPLRILLDTTDGVKVILQDEKTQFPVQNLPLEDMLQIWKKLYYQL